MSIGQKVGYIRVSSKEQNTIRQLDGIQLDKVFTDTTSGKNTDRPELQRMMEFVRDGDTVIVHSLDRFARNLVDLKTMVNLLVDKGVTIEFKKEKLTFSKDNDDKSMSTLFLSVLGAFAEFERELIRERQREGIEHAKKLGKYKGRKVCLTDEQIVEIKNMVKERYKITDIAKKYKVSRATIYKYVQ